VCFATTEGRLLDFHASIFDRALIVPCGVATYAVVVPRTAPLSRISEWFGQGEIECGW
jgi:hypothetical protein